MFKGYLKFGGAEVINVERTMAYTAAGVRPAGVEIESPVGDVEGLGQALGDEPYQTPPLDGAPWYDVNNPDSYGFAGVLPLDITGLDGSTRAAEVTELIGEGGVAQLARRTSRTVAVSALLVGEDDAAIHHGMEWLTRVLHRSCQDDTPAGATLEGFTVPPTVTDAEDLDAALVSELVPVASPDWRGFGGTYNYSTGRFTISGQVTATPTRWIDGGRPNTTASVLDPGISGGTPFDTVDPGLNGGPVVVAASSGYLAAPGILGQISEVYFTWSVAPAGATAVTVTPGAVGPDGGWLATSTPRVVSGRTNVTWQVLDAPWEEWRPALQISAPGADVTLTILKRPSVDAESCVAPYRRVYPNVETIAGPQLVKEIPTDDMGGMLWQVEWTWTADPYRYGDPTTLIAGLPATNAGPATYKATNLQATYLGTVSGTGTACPTPPVPESCAMDPTRPGFLLPPAAPVIADPDLVAPALYHRSLLSLDPAAVGSEISALTFRFANTVTAKRGVRVRIWRLDDPDFTTHVECDFATEFWITYIDSDATLVVDAVTGSVTAVCEDGSLADARGVMRGDYQGAFEFPTVACGQRHYIAVDTPSTQGDLSWTLTVATREG